MQGNFIRWLKYAYFVLLWLLFSSHFSAFRSNGPVLLKSTRLHAFSIKAEGLETLQEFSNTLFSKLFENFRLQEQSQLKQMKSFKEVLSLHKSETNSQRSVYKFLTNDVISTRIRGCGEAITVTELFLDALQLMNTTNLKIAKRSSTARERLKTLSPVEKLVAEVITQLCSNGTMTDIENLVDMVIAKYILVNSQNVRSMLFKDIKITLSTCEMLDRARKCRSIIMVDMNCPWAKNIVTKHSDKLALIIGNKLLTEHNSMILTYYQTNHESPYNADIRDLSNRVCRESAKTRHLLAYMDLSLLVRLENIKHIYMFMPRDFFLLSSRVAKQITFEQVFFNQSNQLVTYPTVEAMTDPRHVMRTKFQDFKSNRLPEHLAKTAMNSLTQLSAIRKPSIVHAKAAWGRIHAIRRKATIAESNIEDNYSKGDGDDNFDEIVVTDVESSDGDEHDDDLDVYENKSYEDGSEQQLEDDSDETNHDKQSLEPVEEEPLDEEAAFEDIPSKEGKFLNLPVDEAYEREYDEKIGTDESTDESTDRHNNEEDSYDDEPFENEPLPLNQYDDDEESGSTDVSFEIGPYKEDLEEYDDDESSIDGVSFEEQPFKDESYEKESFPGNSHHRESFPSVLHRHEAYDEEPHRHDSYEEGPYMDIQEPYDASLHRHVENPHESSEDESYGEDVGLEPYYEEPHKQNIHTDNLHRYTPFAKVPRRHEVFEEEIVRHDPFEGRLHRHEPFAKMPHRYDSNGDELYVDDPRQNALYDANNDSYDDDIQPYEDVPCEEDLHG